MVEVTGLQAVFQHFMKDYRCHQPLSPVQEKACRHSNNAAQKPWADCNSVATAAATSNLSIILAATVIVPNAKGVPSKRGVNISDKQFCR